MSDYVNLRDVKKELEKISKDISGAVDNMCTLIRQQEAELQAKLEDAGERIERQLVMARQDQEVGLHDSDTTSLPDSDNDVSHQSSTEGEADDDDNADEYDDEPVGEIEHQRKVRALGVPIRKIDLAYAGDQPICSIVCIHKSMMCVTHCMEHLFWVYTEAGQLRGTFAVPGMGGICGCVAIDGDAGELSIIDDASIIHNVQLTEDLAIVRHTTSPMQMKVDHLTLGHDNQLVGTFHDENTITVITTSGQVLLRQHVPIPQENVVIACATQTKSGFVMCDFKSNQVYFTDAHCDILHTEALTDPRLAVRTSSGHVFVADCEGNRIPIFTETGHFLGNLMSSEGNIRRPQYIYVDEVQGHIYIGRGRGRGQSARVLVFDYVPVNLPPLRVAKAGQYAYIQCTAADLLCGLHSCSLLIIG